MKSVVLHDMDTEVATTVLVSEQSAKQKIKEHVIHHVHKSNGFKKCKICGSEVSRANYHAHIKQFHSRKASRTTTSTIKCLLCEKEFDDQKKLDRHRDMRHSKTPITYSDVVHEYKCDSCDRVFGQGKPYYRHILITHYGMMEKNLPAVLV